MEEFIVFHHVSVMLKETIDELDIKEDGIYVDVRLVEPVMHSIY